MTTFYYIIVKMQNIPTLVQQLAWVSCTVQSSIVILVNYSQEVSLGKIPNNDIKYRMTLDTIFSVVAIDK